MRHPKHLLLIDNDPIYSYCIGMFLEAEGFTFTISNNPKDALVYLGQAWVSGELPNLIMCELQLPQMSGIELLSVLRSDPLFGHIPTVLVTGDFTIRPSTELAAFEAVLIKPFQLNELLELINRLVIKRVEFLVAAGLMV